MLDEGATAPDFELSGYHEGEIAAHRLSDYTDAGQWVVLTFYAFDFNPVCTAGTCSLRDAEFLQFEGDLAILGVSGDSAYAHEQFAEEHNMNYPLLSDTGKTVGEQYGVLLEEYEEMERVHQRSLFLIDPDRTVRLAVGVDTEDPEDIDVQPLVDSIREIRAQS
jgi:peroxiredoxin